MTVTLLPGAPLFGLSELTAGGKYIVKATEELVPFAVVTETGATPDTPAAIENVAVITLESRTLTLLTVTPGLLTLTAALEEKLVPVICTFTAVPATPLPGLIKVTVGGALDCPKARGTMKMPPIRQRQRYGNRRANLLRRPKTDIKKGFEPQRGAFNEYRTPCNDREPPTGLPGHYSG